MGWISWSESKTVHLSSPNSKVVSKQSNVNAGLLKSSAFSGKQHPVPVLQHEFPGKLVDFCCIFLQFSSLNPSLIDQSDKNTETILSWCHAKMATTCYPNYRLIRIIFSVPLDSIYAESTVAAVWTECIFSHINIRQLFKSYTNRQLPYCIDVYQKAALPSTRSSKKIPPKRYEFYYVFTWIKKSIFTALTCQTFVWIRRHNFPKIYSLHLRHCRSEPVTNYERMNMKQTEQWTNKSGMTSLTSPECVNHLQHQNEAKEPISWWWKLHSTQSCVNSENSLWQEVGSNKRHADEILRFFPSGG